MDRQLVHMDVDAKYRQKNSYRDVRRRRYSRDGRISFDGGFSQNFAMKRTLVPFLAVTLLLITAHRLPAPISEVPESPTPAPEQSAKPKPKRVIHPKTNQSEKSSVAASTPSPTRSKTFAGKWVGTMPEVPWGNIQTELIVDPTETTMEWQDSINSKPATAKATLTGNTLSALFPGWPRPVWSITPDPGGNTAHVRLQAFMNDDHAVFRKTSP
jgi:hypothetical protein